MSIHSAFGYENYNLPDCKPEWMRAERYDYCEQVDKESVTFKGLLKMFSQCLGLF